MKQDKYVAYVGTYTHENSVGIHIYDVDVEQGQLAERKVIPINNPSDLVVSKDRRFLYSIADEGVEAFQILADGDLVPMNKQWIGGAVMSKWIIRTGFCLSAGTMTAA